MMDSLDKAEEAVVSLVAASNKTSRLQSPRRVVEKGFVLLAASSKEEADEAAVVKDQAGRTWIVRARVEVVKAHPAAAAATGQLGALAQGRHPAGPHQGRIQSPRRVLEKGWRTP